MWSVNDFPVCLAAASGTNRTRVPKYVTRLCELLNEFGSADAIPNPTFVALKDVASAVVNDILGVSALPEWTYAVRREYLSGAAYQGRTTNDVMVGMDTQNLTYMSGISEVTGKYKKTLVWAGKAKGGPEDVQRFVNFYVSVLAELVPVAAVIESLKSKVFKRQPKAPEDKVAKYMAPMASKASGKLILDALTEMSKRIYDGVKAALIDEYTEQAKLLNIASIEDQQKNVSMDVFKLDMWDKVGDPIDVRMNGYLRRRCYKYELNGKSTAAIASLAKSQADDMQKEFTVKNASKLASILDKKPMPLNGNPVILSAGGFRGGKFECELRVQFMDGAQFDVKNQVVLKRSIYGKLFMQYPTTFHNVKLAGGVSMAMPSEERMNTVFVKA